MNRTVILSKLAEKKLQKLLYYLITTWSLKVQEDFVKKLLHSIEIIKNNPEAFPQSDIKTGLYKCVISKQTTMYFRFTSSQIMIVNIFDNRQNPTKLNKELQ